MSSPNPVSELILHWEQERDRGRQLSPEELCRDHPGLADEVARRIQALEAFRQLLASTNDRDTVDTVPRRDDPATWPAVPGYEVVAPLGEGGMGVVFKARQAGLNRFVALKMIRGGELAGGERLARFRAEAEAVARLQHPNVVQIHEVGDWQGQPYFSLEYLEGGALDKKLARTPQPPQESAGLVETLARAVQAAHDLGIVHRDLKPANVLLAADGTPKVTDFGLAKQLDSAAGLTQESVAVMGTPGYMAPEQAWGKVQEVGKPADIYSLGAILYEMLTGRPPFLGANSWDTVLQVRTLEPVPPRRLQPRVPRDLETICLKCLHKEPGRRYASARDLAEDLRRFLEDRPILARPVGTAERLARWARRNPVLAGMTAALVALVVGSLAGLGGLLWHAETQRGRAEKGESRALDKEKDARAKYQLARAAVTQMLSRVGHRELRDVQDVDTVREKLLRDALGFFQRFLKETGEDPEVRLETGLAYLQVAEIQGLLQDRDAARKAAGEGMALLTALAEEHPEGAVYQDALADAHQLQAAQAHRNLDFSGSEKASRRALAVFEKLAAGEPGNPEWQFKQAQTHGALGVMFSESRQAERALASLQEAVRLLEELTGSHPGKAAFRASLAKAYDELAVHYDYVLRRKTPAQETYGKALALWDQVVGENPGVRDLRERQGMALNNAGNFYSANGLTIDAENAFRRALPVFEELAAQHPRTPKYSNARATCLDNLGQLYHKANRPGESEDAFLKALPISARLAKEYPQTPDYRHSLARVQLNLARLYLDTKKVPQAVEKYQTAYDLWKDLVRDKPEAVAYRHALAICGNGLGLAYRRQGKTDLAAEAYRTALAAQEALARLRPGVPDFVNGQAIGHNSLGNLCFDAGRWAEAEAAYAKCVAIRKELVAAHPGVLRYQNDLAESYRNLGLALRKQSRVGDAAEAFLESQRLHQNNPAKLFDLGCEFALCLAAADTGPSPSNATALEGRRLGDLALAALDQAAARGFRDIQRLRTNKDLESVRSRPEFQQLLGRLETEAKGGAK